jgi:replicative DNA helicase
MAKCPKCSRDLPLSGKCPFCNKSTSGVGFSLSKFLHKEESAEPAGNDTSPSSTPTESSIVTPRNALPSEPPPHEDNLSTIGFPDPLPAIDPLVLPSSPPPNGASSILATLKPPKAESPVPSPRIDSTVRPIPEAPAPGLPSVVLPEPSKASLLSQLKEKVPGAPKSIALPGDAASKVKDTEKSAFSSQVTGFGDDEMECAVLAGLITDQFILESATSHGLIPDLFSTKYSRSICKAILSLREDNRDGSLIDKIILKSKLKQQSQFDVPMQNFLNRVIAQPAPTLDQVLYYLEILKEQALKRKLKEVSEKITSFIEHPQEGSNTTLEQFTSKVIEEVRNIQKSKTVKRIQLVKEEMRDIIKDIDAREQNGEVEIIGYSFEPFHYLNIALSGFRKGFMYAIAGAPRRGKTTFTLELATATAANNKIPVLFFTYEQTKKNLTYRLLAKESRLNPDSLQRKKIRSDMIMDAKFMGGWKRMQAYMDYFYIVEATKVDTIDRIRAYAYNVMQDFDTENIMIFIDYIQKMPLSRNYMDEKFKVEEISTDLKALCIELNNPIMTISSLSKEGCMIDATESEERPTMYHCKGSGDLEYDLDCAMIQAKDWGDTRELQNQLQHKAEQLNKDPTRIPRVDVVNLYLDKNRDAPEAIFSVMQYLFFIEDNKFIELGPKFDDDRYRFSKIESLVTDLIQRNYIIFHDRERDNNQQKGRVQIKLKNF